MPARGARVLRVLGAADCAAAIVLLTRPRQVSAAVASEADAPPEWVVRLLGVRLLFQGIVQSARPTRSVALTACAIDTTHAATMVVLAAVDSRWRRAAVGSAAVAGGSALVAATCARSTFPR